MRLLAQRGHTAGGKNSAPIAANTTKCEVLAERTMIAGLSDRWNAAESTDMFAILFILL